MLIFLWYNKVYDIYRYNTTLQISTKKKSDILVWTFIFDNFFGCNVPPPLYQ
jgi:hypothetical protein